MKHNDLHIYLLQGSVKTPVYVGQEILGCQGDHSIQLCSGWVAKVSTNSGLTPVTRANKMCSRPDAETSISYNIW